MKKNPIDRPNNTLTSCQILKILSDVGIFWVGLGVGGAIKTNAYHIKQFPLHIDSILALKDPPPQFTSVTLYFYLLCYPFPITIHELTPIHKKTINLKPTRCVYENTNPPIMNKSKDGQDHKNNFFETSRYCQKKWSCATWKL